MSLWASAKKHRIVAVSLLLLVSVAAFAALRVVNSNSVEVSEPLARGSIVESVYGIGTVTATRSFHLKWGVTSTIRGLYVKEGDFVRRGQRLIRLDDASFSAPFDGTVTALPFKEGETVFAQTALLSLVDLTDRYLIVSVEQRGALRVRRGQKARISVDSMRAESYDGVVGAVYSNENNFLIRIDVSSLPPQILPGMTADVAITIDERKDVLLVPVAAIDGGRVYVKRGAGRGKAIPVKIGLADGAMAELLAGDVREGDQLVLRGVKKQ